MKERLIWTDQFDGEGISRNPMLESHSHDHYELSFVIKGNLTVLFDSRNYKFTDNCVILSPPNTAHHIIVSQGRYFRYNLYFYKAALDTVLGYDKKLAEIFQPGGQALLLQEQTVARIRSAIELLIEETRNENKSLLLGFILNTISQQCGSATAEQPKSCIDDAMRIILNEYPQKLISSEIASRCFVSRTKLMTEFKKKTGYTLLEYITFVRLAHAKEMLLSGNNVYETAIQCGFVNAANFTRVFKKQTGLTPKEYQKGNN